MPEESLWDQAIDPYKKLERAGYVQDANGKWVQGLTGATAYEQQVADELGLKIDESTKDAIVQYILSEKGAENAQARSLEFNREQYSALVEGLKRAGLNPFLAIQGLSGANMMSGQSQSSGKYAELQVAKSQRENQAKTSILSAALMAIAIVVAHAI